METRQLQLVTLEQAKRLKEAGFDWKTYRTYKFSEEVAIPISEYNYNSSDNRISAPTVALALKWVRDTKGIFSQIDFDLVGFRKGYYFIHFSFDNKESIKVCSEKFSTYEAAESALLDELLTILESL